MIPEVVRPVLAERPAGLPEWTFPTECPVCGGLQRLDERAATYCINLGCPARRATAIEHFASRGAMDIEGSASRRCGCSWSRACSRHRGHLLARPRRHPGPPEGFGETSVNNLAAAIEASKQRRWATSWWGSASATSAAPAARCWRHFHLDALLVRPGRTSPACPASGPIIARSVHGFFADGEPGPRRAPAGAAGVNFQGSRRRACRRPSPGSPWS